MREKTRRQRETEIERHYERERESARGGRSRAARAGRGYVVEAENSLFERPSGNWRGGIHASVCMQVKERERKGEKERNSFSVFDDVHP